MIYNDEQWAIIKKGSPHYITSRQDYIRNVPRWLLENIIEIYESATGKIILNKDLSCAVCVLNIIKTVAKTYFSDLDEREKLEENKDGITKTNTEPNQRDKKKKVGSDGNGKKRGIEDKN
jgi:hypothetical protein